MVKSESDRELVIHLPHHQYPIICGHGLLTEPGLISTYLDSKQVVIVTNETIAPLYLTQIVNTLSAYQCDVVILKDGEQFKDYKSLFAIYDALIANQHHRDTTLIALGGGVIGDLTGFAASTYYRGVSFIQIPTTLLAQVDAAVGGKTAINYSRTKNSIGSFYQPNAVIIDLDTLQTLPLREFYSGFAEIIKYALLDGYDFFYQIDDYLQRETPRDPLLLKKIINHCCQIKASIVQRDEREQGGRAFLNLGHTFAHALESYTHYRHWLHGEAVAIGLYCAALLSFHMNNFPMSSVNQLDKMLAMAKLPRRIPANVDLNALYALMRQDKKIKNDKLRFILLHEIGDCYIDDSVPESLLLEVLQEAQEK